MHAHTRAHAKASTQPHTISLPLPLPLSFLFECSSPGFEATILRESDTLFLTYALWSGFFITATRSVTKGGRG